MRWNERCVAVFLVPVCFSHSVVYRIATIVLQRAGSASAVLLASVISVWRTMKNVHGSRISVDGASPWMRQCLY
jgi:hypothetical protein